MSIVLRVCVGSILAFYQIRDENRAKLKISYSCGHRVSKSARYDATLNECLHEKPNNLGIRPGLTLTGLYSHKSRVEA